MSPNGHLVAFDGQIYTDSYTTNNEVAVYSLITHRVRLAPFIEEGFDDDIGPAWFPGSNRLIFPPPATSAPAPAAEPGCTPRPGRQAGHAADLLRLLVAHRRPEWADRAV